jgi:hypothetical protein
MLSKITIWKKISRVSFVVIVITLAVKMMFREHYGFSGMVTTSTFAIIAILLFIASEAALMILNKKKNE